MMMMMMMMMKGISTTIKNFARRMLRSVTDLRQNSVMIGIMTGIYSIPCTIPCKIYVAFIKLCILLQGKHPMDTQMFQLTGVIRMLVAWICISQAQNPGE